jgi:hypothetical protein
MAQKNQSGENSKPKDPKSSVGPRAKGMGSKDVEVSASQCKSGANVKPHPGKKARDR